MEWPEPWSRLAACGWTTARLGTLDDLPRRGLREILEKAWGREATEEELEEFHKKVQECGSTGRIQWGEGRSGGLDWVAAGFKRARTFRHGVAAEVVDLEAPPCRKDKAPVARWPCWLSRLVGRAGDNMDLRDRAERSERTRWTVMLKMEPGLPASVGWNADPDGTAWHWIGKGRRSTTLRKHVKTWRHVATWLYSAYNAPWPQNVEQFIEYITHRVAEPCGKSIPTSLMKTLMFIEVAREVQEKDEAYVRCIRGNVEKAQEMMAKEIGGPDKLDEESIMEKVVEKLATYEMDPNDVEDQKLRLTSFQGGVFAAGSGGAGGHAVHSSAPMQLAPTPKLTRLLTDLPLHTSFLYNQWPQLDDQGKDLGPLPVTITNTGWQSGCINLQLLSIRCCLRPQTSPRGGGKTGDWAPPPHPARPPSCCSGSP